MYDIEFRWLVSEVHRELWYRVKRDAGSQWSEWKKVVGECMAPDGKPTQWEESGGCLQAEIEELEAFHDAVREAYMDNSRTPKEFQDHIGFLLLDSEKECES